MERIIVFSAPSGSGKSTVINHLLNKIPCLGFSVSATSRSPSGDEKDGVNYHFISKEDFMGKVQNNEFIEWEEVYNGTCYGTLFSELDRIEKAGKTAVFDLDVYGALNIKKKYPNAFLIFIVPPSLDELSERLERRGTDSKESIQKRLKKAEEEISHAKEFDYILLNDDLEEALEEAEQIVKDYIERSIVPGSFYCH